MDDPKSISKFDLGNITCDEDFICKDHILTKDETVTTESSDGVGRVAVNMSMLSSANTTNVPLVPKSTLPLDLDEPLMSSNDETRGETKCILIIRGLLILVSRRMRVFNFSVN